ncbi:MAG TPA: hypothetical protein VKB84_14065 [Candidatus Binataceae bacterium]|nr:hypothetical protein [Candidatus Binataceae bacterium]
MKKLFLILIAAFAVVMAHDFNGAYAGAHHGDDDGGIPLSKLAGKYSVIFNSGGFFTQCFKPDFSATESCSTPGAVPFNLTGATVGQSTQDRDGNACQKFTGAFSATVGQKTPLILEFISVVKVTTYDPATGSGDTSVTDYSGGKCIGSKFDSTGATPTNTGAQHFVASDDGRRVDFTVTAFTDPLGDIGATILTGTYFKQNK